MIELIVWTAVILLCVAGIFIAIANAAEKQNEFNSLVQEAESLERKNYVDGGLTKADRSRLYDITKIIEEKRARDRAYAGAAAGAMAGTAWMKYMSDWDKK